MITTLFDQFAQASSCGAGKNFLGFPTWYKYLEQNADCVPRVAALNDIWLVIAAVLEILLRIAAIGAVVFIIVGAVEFVFSQGEPDKVAKARGTIVNAVVGLVIAIASTAIVTYIAGRF